MRILLISALCCAAVAAAYAAPPAPPAADHPILGTWNFDFPDRDCEETYRFYPAGTTLDTSGDEVTESVYEISAKPVANGFYKLVTKVVKGNGKKDCSGEITKVGEASTNYVVFHSTGESFIMCKGPTLQACFGPLVRAHGKLA